MVSQRKFWKATLLFAIMALSFPSVVESLFRGYRETCGTHLHARSRDTVAEGRQCDKTKGLACTRYGVCDCSSSNVRGEVERMVWNRTHCVAKLNATCRISQSHPPELSFLPHVNRTEELFCGRYALCSEEGCWCEPDFYPDMNHVNCVSENGQSILEANFLFTGIVVAAGTFYAVLLTLLQVQNNQQFV